MSKKCINYAHRGASEYAPENTLLSFNLGVFMGADGMTVNFPDKLTAYLKRKEGN